MRRILFVDDEPRVLDGLRRMLYPRRKEWEMEFAVGGDAALAACAKSPFDVVISDMRMPGMDGATLLMHMKQRYPNSVRIILTGQSSQEAAMRAVPVAHQFLNKPCEASALQEVITRACNVQDLLASSDLREIVGSLESLPGVPRTYAAIRQKLSESEWTIADLADIIEYDPALVAKILQIANSGFFALPRHVYTLIDAISFLGASTIEKLVLSIEVVAAFGQFGQVDVATIERHHHHSHLVGRIAQSLHQERHLAESSFTAGLLHDVGLLVLATCSPERFAQAASDAHQTRRPMFRSEKDLFGVTHAEVGAYLLGIWGLPFPIVEAAAFHHRPTEVASSQFDVVSSVYVAGCLAEEAQPGGTGDLDPYIEPMSEQFLESKGIAGKLDQWRKLAAALAEGAVKLEA